MRLGSCSAHYFSESGTTHDTSSLKYASLKNKVTLIKEAGALGLLTKDDGREIIDLPPIGGAEGKKMIQSLNNINSQIADDYQGGKKNGKND